MMTRTNRQAESVGVLAFKPLLLKAGALAAIAGVCWYGLARPVVMRAGERREALERTERTLERHAEQRVSGAELERARQEVGVRLSNAKAWALRPEESGKLYESFRGLAKAAAVRIERIEPKGESSLGAMTKAKAGEAGGLTARAIGYSLEVTGTYEAVARFLSSCETELGSSRVVSFRLSPSVQARAGGPTLVVATLETQHVCLKLDEAADGSRSAAAGEPR